jgi:hypothetical protein
VKESLPKLMLLRVSNCEEESPYKPEVCDSGLFVVIAHVSAHKELQGFTKAIKLLSKSLI